MIIQIFGLAIISILIAEWYSPLQKLKNKWRWYEHPLLKHTYCVKCVSFNLALLITWNLYIAGIVCIFAYTISFLIDKMEYDRYGN
jgi:hypothetical protein